MSFNTTSRAPGMARGTRQTGRARPMSGQSVIVEVGIREPRICRAARPAYAGETNRPGRSESATSSSVPSSIICEPLTNTACTPVG